MKATLHITLAVTTFVLSHIVIAQTNNLPPEFSTPTKSELSPGTTLYVIKGFFLTTSDGGLQGVSVGKKVTLIREEMGDYIITDGINEGRAPISSLTSDQKAAEQVRLITLEKDKIIAEQLNHITILAINADQWKQNADESKQNAEQWKQSSAYWENVAKERLKLVEMAIAIIDKQERQNSTGGMTEINRQLQIIRNQQLMH